jgi:myo-inositol-1(or 4)-monophosphatase
MEGSPFPEMLNLATALAVEAASISLSTFGKVVARRKPDDSVVTDTDNAIQARIVQRISETYPDHAILAEECGWHGPRLRGHGFAPCEAPANAEYVWVVDPLDGTRNYASGLAYFATSIAVLEKGRPIVGVVYEHNLRHLYTATAGGGAFLNGRSIRVVEPPASHDHLIGVPSSKDDLTVRVLREWVATEGFILRNFGAATLHLGMVASGALEAAYVKQSKIWDVAAGALLVREAGGRITDPSGGELLPFTLEADPNRDIPFLAGGPTMHARLLQSIREATY